MRSFHLSNGFHWQLKVMIIMEPYHSILYLLPIQRNNVSQLETESHFKYFLPVGFTESKSRRNCLKQILFAELLKLLWELIHFNVFLNPHQSVFGKKAFKSLPLGCHFFFHKSIMYLILMSHHQTQIPIIGLSHDNTVTVSGAIEVYGAL